MRHIDVTKRQWRFASGAKVGPRWSLSQKGNLYTKIKNRSIVVMEAMGGLWRWSISPLEEGGKWEQSPTLYNTVEEAKAAALETFGMSATPSPPPETRRDEPSGPRKIIV